MLPREADGAVEMLRRHKITTDDNVIYGTAWTTPGCRHHPPPSPRRHPHCVARHELLRIACETGQPVGIVRN